ncbi:DUF4179 domain-containing protein [Cytobacillus depressus]|uniref:DUF4179 domain-containing protein n=1 Tax=Cytobacillus depressus TaxID=1602942 RepID=A0A6L3V914_9BACI|nr:DUF4179 domain-containing protein [Cytobacillus depressus]KAB2334784.1 DUF4179 domain-containing protein [Cytobacillus depressus]
MFEKEEQQLAKWKKAYDDMPFPEDKIEEAILKGYNRAVVESKVKPRRKKWLFSSMAAAILIISFLTSIRISPAFAHYVSVIPGMEKIVELFSDNKGLMSAVENEYMQEINATQEKNGVKVTIDSVIADENGMVVFYTLETKENQELFDIRDINFKSADGTELSLGSYSGGIQMGESRKSQASAMEFYFQKPLTTKQFIVDFTIITDDYKESFQFPFSIEKPLKVSKTYTLNKAVTIEDQKVIIKDIQIYPLRAAVHIVMDPENSKKIFAFEDIRLVDENGESWTKIANGVTASHISENEQIVYLQSNYFKQPKELYLVINKLQAVDKEDAYVVVDTEKQQILKQPTGNHLTNVKLEGQELRFVLDTNSEFFYATPFNSMKDVNGETVYFSQFLTSDDNGNRVIGVNLPSKQEINYPNPIELELCFFPSWIKGDVHIKVE